MKSLLKRKKLLIGIALILIAILFLRSGSKGKTQTVMVRSITPENRVVVRTVSSSGEVKSVNQADLAFAGGQRVTSILVKKGDSVKRGALLATIENQSALQTAQSYKDSRDVAIRQRDLFVRNEDANKDTLGGQDQFNIKLRELDEAISQATALYNAQLANVRNSYMYAPFDGTIVDVTKEVGEMATAGETVITVADLNKLQFEIEIDQEDYGQLKKDLPAEIELDAYPNVVFKGKVVEIPMYASAASFVTKIDFETLEQKPLLGMTGDAKIATQTTGSEVKSLYYDQVYFDEENKPYVWVVDGEFISKFPIEIGLEGDIYTEIKSNTDGKQIIAPLTSDIEVKDGYKARIAK